MSLEAPGRYAKRRWPRRLAAYLLIVGPWLAAAAVASHFWVPESWWQSIRTGLLLLGVFVMYGEVRAWLKRRIR